MLEDEILYYTIPYIDNENDNVFYYLTTIPRLGSAHVDVNTGLLTYKPCQNCFGTENLGIYIIERELEFGEELDDSGTLQIMIENDDDPLILFFFESISQNDTRLNISSNSIIQVYIEANRTNPVTIAKVGVYDYDGYNDDLEVFVIDGGEGISGYKTWLDIVSVSESLPVNWEGNEIEYFTGYVTFLGADITYLPSDPSFTGTDSIQIYARQEDNTFSEFLTVYIEVVPSLCLNDGICGGSVDDPNCEDIESRRDKPGNYSCTCLTGFTGSYCEKSLVAPVEEEEESGHLFITIIITYIHNIIMYNYYYCN